jgi:hypothetical protein
MKIDEEFSYKGIFTVSDIKLHGILTKKIDKPYTDLKLLSPNRLESFPENEYKKIDSIQGVIQSSSSYVSIFKAVIFFSKVNSNGLFEYTVRSKFIIFNLLSSTSYNEYTLPHIFFINPNFSNYLGSTNISVNHDSISHKIHIDFSNNEKMAYPIVKDLSIVIDSTVNFERDFSKCFLLLKQLNRIYISESNSLKFDDIISYFHSSNHFITFILQTRSISNEVFFIDYEEINGKKIQKTRDVFIGINDPLTKEYSEEKALFTRKEISENFSLYYTNFIIIYKAIKYLNFFFEGYYLNEFIDQKVILQINLIEALYKHQFGTKPIDLELKSFCDRILSQIDNFSDKERLSGLFSQKTGISIKRKIRELSEFCKFDFPDELLKFIHDYRNSFSHGNLIEYDINKLVESDEHLMNLINAYIVKLITNT